MSKDKFLMPKSRPNNAKKILETLSKEGNIEQLTSEEIERILKKKPKKPAIKLPLDLTKPPTPAIKLPLDLTKPKAKAKPLNNKIENSEQIKEMLENSFSRDVGPEYIEIETGKKSKITPKKFSGGKLAELMGPFEVSPSVTKQTTVEGKISRDTKAASLGIGTKFGNIRVGKSDTTERMVGAGDYKTKSKDIAYDKRINIGKNTTLDVLLKQGESRPSIGDASKTKGASLTITKKFGGPKMKTGGMCRGMGKAIRGGKFTGVK